MRVTEKKLRQLIREAISGSDPQSLYDRKLEIEKQYGSYVLLLSRIGEEDYKAIYDMREQMYEADSSRSGYAKFQPQTKREYSVFASLAYKMWYDGMPQPEELFKVAAEHEGLAKQFKTVDGTSQVDRVYGRKRTDVLHVPTNTKVKSSTDRKGSLGT